ncbi:MAG: transglycosylase domain-containing protein, partial [Desulfobacterales bacterium]
FTRLAAKLTYRPAPGPYPEIRFPQFGPYDIRMGYTRIPQWRDKLNAQGYEVTRQAQWSPELIKAVDLGVFATYREKTRSGFSIRDHEGRSVWDYNFPELIYPDFESIPPVLVLMLLFIENRHLLDSSAPHQNPAIEWKRLTKSLFDSARARFDKGRHVTGGSTLATQLEKFRHSPLGMTDTAAEKLRQIISASLRTYAHGAGTGRARKQIVLDYINSIPLAAAPGFGEVLGLGDGLCAWYGLEFDSANRLLFEVGSPNIAPHRAAEIGRVLKAALSLFLAQRRPSVYLLTHREKLNDLVNAHCRLMTTAGLISPHIRDAAIASHLNFSQRCQRRYEAEKPVRKAVGFLRVNLMTTLGMDRLYDLDRLDLEAHTAIDIDLQRAITQNLYELKDPLNIVAAGLKAPNLLPRGDPSKVIYSFSLYERTPFGNMLRVQTNNYDGAFNIDEQMKLDMGSSAKLRVLVHYLEILTKLHAYFHEMPTKELKRTAKDITLDPLSRWCIEFLLSSRESSLSALLDAAMQRRYSASTGERFFTGGGQHTFTNFNKQHNNQVMTVSQAFRHSVNLVFIRIMRDIVYYHVHQRYGVTPRSLEKISTDDKSRLLAMFADQEGNQFIRRFYHKYRAKSSNEARQLLFMGIRPMPVRLAAAFRFVTPEASLDTFSAFFQEYLPGSRLNRQYIEDLYSRYGPRNFSLADIGYLAHIHPLELWLVAYLQHHPGAGIEEVIQNSAERRQEVYRWLFKTKSPAKQYRRIRTIIELEAFQDIHRQWKRLGYPFDYLVPSYANAIGSSGDRPSALAQLIGIILNEGVLYSRQRFTSLHFAEATPYETLMALKPATGQRMLEPETAQIAKNALLEIVAQGTAVRLKNIVSPTDGKVVIIGGKTGTGDHRYKTFGPGGNLLSSKVMNRTAIFVFFLGDRHFGTISAYVAGPDAAKFEFSSSLPVTILKILTERTVLLSRLTTADKN